MSTSFVIILSLFLLATIVPYPSLNQKKHESCFNYVESIQVIHVDEIILNDKGAYTIKVLVKDSSDPKVLYDVQMTHNLYVNFPSK